MKTKEELLQLKRGELNDLAVVYEVVEPKKLKNREAVVDAILESNISTTLVEKEAKHPLYESNKKDVWAIEIGTIIKNREGGATITPVNKEYPPFEVTPYYMRTHNPMSGGYYMEFTNGELSYNSAETFKADYELA
jgi:hypothetical protein